MGQRRVLVIGWDGADWKVASPLLDAGQMPNLQRLINGGVMGNISTLYPVLSPMLWTSIATGKRAHKHGIHGFVEPDPRTGSIRPVTNLGRKCKAVWNILNQNGKRCNVVGWWPSHPAEPIHGVMVSNHFQATAAPLDQPRPMRPGTIHPESQAAHLGKFRVHPGEIQAEQILPFVPRARQIDQTKDGRIAGIARNLAQGASVHAAATALMQHEPWDFMAVYYDTIDHFCHGFMKYHPPRETWVDAEDFERYRDVINACYRFHDMMLGTLLALAGEDTTVLLLSDHGFHPDHLRPQTVGNEPAGPADEHRQFGMLVINGPGIKKDQVIHGASLLDITPTVLSLFGLPIGRDMDGRPLLSAYDKPPELDPIDSWEDVPGDDGRHPPGARIDAVDAHESIQQLVELGYIDPPDGDGQKQVRDAVRELRYNLARDYADARRYPEAIRVFAALWDASPDESRFGIRLFNCYLATEYTAEAEATLDRLVEQKQQYAKQAREELKARQEATAAEKSAPTSSPEEGQPETPGPPAPKTDAEARQEAHLVRKLVRRAQTNPAAFAYFRGCLLHAQGHDEQALEVLERAKGVQAYNQPSLRHKIGECYLGLRDWQKAHEQFTAMLKLDPVNAQAHIGLAQSELGRGNAQRAFEAALTSVGLVYHNPRGHYLCARALQRLGNAADAADQLETALKQNPVFPDAHRLLAEIHTNRGDTARATEHAQLAEAAQHRLDAFRDGSIPEDTDLALDVALDEAIGIGTLNRTGTDPKTAPIVVVSGLPRSGTSMMMQMLAAGGHPVLVDQHRPPDESNPRGYFEYAPARQLAQQSAWVRDAPGKAVKLVAQLLPALPADHDYRVIFMARPLAEVIASQSKMLKRLGRQGANLSDRRLAASYKNQIAKVTDTLARRPQAAAITIDYTQALANPEQTARQVNTFLGGKLDEQAMASTIDAGLRHEHT